MACLVRKRFFCDTRKFESFWDEKTIEKGKGWKQFKRWEAFMAPRVNQDGSFPYKSLLGYLKKKIKLDHLMWFKPTGRLLDLHKYHCNQVEEKRYRQIKRN